MDGNTLEPRFDTPGKVISYRDMMSRSNKRKRGRMSKRKKPAEIIEEELANARESEHAPALREYPLKGVLETNLWARKVCRDHRNLCKDYADLLKTYEVVEPQMYKVGRTFDKILNSLKTSLPVQVDHPKTRQRLDYDNRTLNLIRSAASREFVATTTEVSGPFDMESASIGYFTLINSNDS